MQITIPCVSANRTLTQEQVVFGSPQAPTLQVQPATPAKPTPPRASVGHLTVAIYDPAEMGKYVPGQQYVVTIG